MINIFHQFESISTGIFIIDNNFKVVFWNSYLEDWTLVNASEITGKPIVDFFSAFNNDTLKLRLQPVFDFGTPLILSSTLNSNLLKPKNINLASSKHDINTVYLLRSNLIFASLLNNVEWNIVK